jgi:uncharacterized protein VirK/YbjX
MGRPRLLDSRKLLKRVRQLAYLGAHPIKHGRCVASIRNSGLSADPITALKYIGDHLALSLTPSQRRRALAVHYTVLARLLRSWCAAELQRGVRVWRKAVGHDLPYLTIHLEPARLAPMEGELQLRFSFRSDLCVLTFMIAPGDVFGSSAKKVLFIGGIQGRMGARKELREASRLNDEISPAAMLILTVQAIAKKIGISEIIGVGEDEHISMAYARARIAFDYERFWREAGAVRIGCHYRLPLQSAPKPLSNVPLSHRSRARRRREAKALIRESIDRRLDELFSDDLDALTLSSAA